MGRIVKSIFGGAEPTPTPVAEAPTPDVKPVEDVEEAARKAKKSRAALFETKGGVAGEELEAGGVTKRNTLLGN